MNLENCTRLTTPQGKVHRIKCTTCGNPPPRRGFRFFLTGGQHVCDTHGLEHYRASLVPQAQRGTLKDVNA